MTEQWIGIIFLVNHIDELYKKNDSSPEYIKALNDILKIIRDYQKAHELFD